MLQGAIGGLILLGIFKLILPKDNVIDWWVSFVFIFVPGLFGMLLVFVLGLTGLPLGISLVYYLAYFFLPLYWFREVEEFSWGRSAKFSAIVPVVGILSEVGAVMLLGVN